MLDTAVGESQSQYSIEDTDYFTMGTNESEFMVNVESRNGFNSYGDLQEELNTPEVPGEMVPGGWEHEEQVVLPCTNNTVTGEEEEYSLGNTVKKNGLEEKEKVEKKKELLLESKKSLLKNQVSLAKNQRRRSSSIPVVNKKSTLEKELFETPDDAIRFLPIRDMLRLVEYKEWLEKKDAKGVVVPPTQESNTNTSKSHYCSRGFNAEDEFGIESSENQEMNVVKPDSPVNYQTYMNKTSRTRWSKQDTELFYEGIQEFGSNLSMVQQLFPNRTREQMKLKFKLEERRHPMKLNDALSSCSKHFTHFHTVIKKLQQEAAAARESNAEEETGAEAETTDVPENELEKSEEIERANDEVAGVKESDGAGIENSVRSDSGDECDDDEGDDFWNSYRSDM